MEKELKNKIDSLRFFGVLLLFPWRFGSVSKRSQPVLVSQWLSLQYNYEDSREVHQMPKSLLHPSLGCDLGCMGRDEFLIES